MFKVIGNDTYLTEIGKWTKSEIKAAEKIPEQFKEYRTIAEQISKQVS